VPSRGFRRGLIFALSIGVGIGLDAALWMTLAPGGWTGAKLVMLVSFALATPWAGFYFANGLIGLILILTRGPGFHDRAELAVPLPMTALAVTVRNEDMATVLPPLRALLDELDSLGLGDRFALCVLSDTMDPALARVEEAAIAAFRATDPRPDRVRYRRRTENTGFKAGNVMEFLDNHAQDFTLMVALDADSRMSARAVLRLVNHLAADPGLAIAQHLIVGQPASSAFPRLFQFGMRAGMRTWSTALAWWQDNESCYWGHNAGIRIAAFRDHARLPLLPGGRHILSHDQVEAALLAGAGWGVRLIPEEDGSTEANPPAFPEFIRRDARWLAGNLEYRHLLRLPVLRPMGRWQLIQAILLFGISPLYLVLLLAAAWAAVTDAISAFPLGWAVATILAWIAAMYAPKLMGYLEVLISNEKSARYGGRPRVLGGAALEMAFALAIDPITLLSKTATLARVLTGRSAGWAPQNRADRGVTWAEAARLLWPQTLLGVAVFAAFAWAGWAAFLLALPLAGGLLIAVPFCVVTADPRVGAWLRLRGIAAIPEEVPPGTPTAIRAGSPPRSV
jgi:membrane glycosyltransferase